MVNSATSYSSTSTCQGYYSTGRVLQGTFKKVLQLASMVYGFYQAPTAFHRGGGREAIHSLIIYMGLIPFALEGVSPVFKGEYLSNCSPETMARIEGTTTKVIQARAKALGDL